MFINDQLYIIVLPGLANISQVLYLKLQINGNTIYKPGLLKTRRCTSSDAPDTRLWAQMDRDTLNMAAPETPVGRGVEEKLSASGEPPSPSALPVAAPD